MPDVRNLTTVLAWQPATHVSDEEARSKALPRLRELKALCDQYDVRLIILVPPSLRNLDANTLPAVAKAVDIPLLMPAKPGEMSAALFRDGFHLNSAGAKIFTEKLRSQLTSLDAGPTVGSLDGASVASQ